MSSSQSQRTLTRGISSMIRSKTHSQSRRFTTCINAEWRDRERQKRLQHSPWRKQHSTTTQQTPNVLINDMANQEILVDFLNGDAGRYPAFWLRDHCLCSECTHPSTLQRQINSFALDADTKAVKAEPTLSGLQISWSGSAHSSTFPWSWLRSHSPFTAQSAPPLRQWTHISPVDFSSLPTVPFSDVMENTSVLQTLLSNIRTYGFSFVASTPPNPIDTESLLNRIAFIRHTHYGGFWDFTSNPTPIDTAYTNLSLSPHTDTTYFTDPCGLQLFHLLSHTSSTTPSIPMSGQGGSSTFVDGFAAAQYLHRASPTHYSALSTVRVISHASGSTSVGSINNTSLHPGFPVFTHTLPTSTPHPRNLVQVRWNNDDRSPHTKFPSHAGMKLWYDAARHWTKILELPEFLVKVKLVPGTPVIFDNWRVLHGRDAFEGERRMCGGYIGMDDFLARCRAVGVEGV